MDSEREIKRENKEELEISKEISEARLAEAIERFYWAAFESGYNYREIESRNGYSSAK